LCESARSVSSGKGGGAGIARRKVKPGERTSRVSRPGLDAAALRERVPLWWSGRKRARASSMMWRSYLSAARVATGGVLITGEILVDVRKNTDVLADKAMVGEV